MSNVKRFQEPVIIAGAGPGGLCLALLLAKANIPVRVFEAVKTLKPLGVGINLLPHSVRVLTKLGLLPRLQQQGLEATALRFCNKYGQTIKSEPRGKHAGYHYPQISIHRGKLQMILLQEAIEQLGKASIVTGHALESWRDHGPRGIEVRLRTREGKQVTIRGSCLVAADGIHSIARKRLYPDEGQPLYSGSLLWRATSRTQAILDGETMVVAGHNVQKFSCYPISRQDDDGLQDINWLAELKVVDGPDLEQDWTKQVTKEEFFDPFTSWTFDWLDVPALISKATSIFQYPMTDRDPLKAWTRGNVTLLGDAAHPMYPIGSNGASQAILDAEALVEALKADELSIQEALKMYEASRLAATALVVLSNRVEGPDRILQIAEDRAPQGFDNIDDVISAAELEAISLRYKQTAGFSLPQVNR